MNSYIIYIVGFLALAGLIFSAGMIILSVRFFRQQRKNAGIICLCIGIPSLVFPVMMSIILFLGILYYSSLGFEPYKEVTFSPEGYKGPMGTLVFGTKCKSELRGSSSENNTNYTFSSEDGVFKIPADNILIYSYSIYMTDKSGKEWKASSYNLKDIPIFTNNSPPPASPLEIKAGPPLKSKITVSEKSGDKVSLSLSICDMQGEEFSINLRNDDNPDESTPGFELISPSGEKIWQGQFKYG